MSTENQPLEWRSVLDAVLNTDVRTVLPTVDQSGVVAFTGGACLKNPGGPAGWSAILLAVDDVTGSVAREDAVPIECYGYIPQSPTTTNNRAEITAVLAVLCVAAADYPLKIYSLR